MRQEPCARSSRRPAANVSCSGTELPALKKRPRMPGLVPGMVRRSDRPVGRAVPGIAERSTAGSRCQRQLHTQAPNAA
jgi:hypothetical protein